MVAVNSNSQKFESVSFIHDNQNLRYRFKEKMAKANVISWQAAAASYFKQLETPKSGRKTRKRRSTDDVFSPTAASSPASTQEFFPPSPP